jgi:UDP-3-O-[3-hydroxymyristoyl] N-acetylglucosamine deacetylase
VKGFIVQTTLRSTVKFSGIGLHSGVPVNMRIMPASAEYGLWFRRADVNEGDPLIAAHWDNVVSTRLCTTIANASGVSVSTVEHVLAALSGCGVHNAVIELDGPETPILDGSAAPFVRGIQASGIRALPASVRALRILKSVEVREGDAIARLDPSESFRIDFMIDFPDDAIGHQTKSLCLANGAFARELSDARTFCRHADIRTMRANGLALGGSFENAVVVDGPSVLTPGGLRHPDEAVRHKMLDALGDLSLAGAPILGRYTGLRAGHTVTNKLLHALFADVDAFRMVHCSFTEERNLPGGGNGAGDLRKVA